MKFAYQVVFLVFALILAGCGQREGTAPLQDIDEGGSVWSEIPLGKPRKMAIDEPILCAGKIELPPQNMFEVHSPVQAFIRKIIPKSGDRVRRNGLLAVVEHPELIRLQRAFLESAARYRALKADFERQSTLAASEATPQRKLEEARSAFEEEEARYRGLKAEIALVGLPVDQLESKGEIQSHLEIRSPTNGYVDHIYVNTGQLIKPEQSLFQVLNPEHMHLELQVYARDHSKVRNGQRIVASIPGTSDTLHGEVYLVGKAIDPATNTALVHGHLDEAHTPYAPGSYLQAQIYSGAGESWAVPENAILREGESTYVLRYVDHHIQRIPVVTGPSHEGWIATPDLEWSGPDNLVMDHQVWHQYQKD